MDQFEVVVEVPKGSRNKYEVDHVTGQIWLDRELFTATRYPADYGYIPGTLEEDGDPLDVLVLLGEPTFPGCRIPVRAVGVLRTEDERGQDDKVLCVPFHDPNWSGIEQLSDVPEGLRNEIEHFFSMYKEPEGRAVTIHGWEDREVALGLIDEARERYRDQG